MINSDRFCFYIGHELHTELQTLIKFIDCEIDRLTALLPTVQNEDTVRGPLNRHLPSVERTIKRLRMDRLDAVIWAKQCLRTPDSSWSLTMDEMRWLFRMLGHESIRHEVAHEK